MIDTPNTPRTAEVSRSALSQQSVLKGPIFQAAIYLHRRRWLLLLLAAPFLLFPSPISVPILLVVPGLSLIAGLSGNDVFPRTPLNVPLLALNLMVLVSTQVTFDMAVSLPKIAGMMLGMGVFHVFVTYGRRARDYWSCVLVFGVTALGMVFLGILGTNWSAKYSFLQSFTDRFFPRIFFELPGVEKGFNANTLAGALLWVIPVFAALSLVAFVQQRGKDPSPRRWLVPAGWLLAEVTLFVMIVFLICQSRGAYLALAISGLVLIPMLLPRHGRRLFVIGLIVFIPLIGIQVKQSGADALLDEVTGSDSTPRLVEYLDTLGGRTLIWQKAILGIERFPLTGMGMNTFRYVMNTLEPKDPIYVGRDIGHAHDEFLQAALDLGIPGSIALAALYLSALAMLREVWKRANEDPAGRIRELPDAFGLTALSTRLLVVGLGGGLLAHFLFGLTDAIALGAKPGVLFWMLLALIVSLYQQKWAQTAGQLSPTGGHDRGHLSLPPSDLPSRP